MRSLTRLILTFLLIPFFGCSVTTTFHMPGPPQVSFITASNSQLRMSDRNYVASVLTQIYAPAAGDATIHNLVINQIDAFGGPCDSYVGDCLNLSQTQSPVVPLMTASRGALTTRVCDLLNSNDTYVTNAVSSLDKGQYSVQNMPNSDGFTAAFQAFYPGKTPSKAVIGGLALVARSGNTAPVDQWRFALLTLCYDPMWQVP